jgi:16S rRNA (cytosine967-C5)-methyltransferase
VRGQKPREIAAQILGRRGGRDFIEDLLEQALARSSLAGPDRHLCQELVYGIVRWQAALDWLIARKTDERPQKSLLQNILRLGLYQIFWLERIPNHAAVNESVELAKQTGFGAQAGFINAVLRGYLREYDATRQLLAELKINQPHLGYSHPEWLATRWQTRWGADKTAQLFVWNNTPPKTFARVNTLKIDAARLLPQWRDENVEYDFVRRDWLEENLVFELKSFPLLHGLPSFQQGLFYIQDPSTLLAVRALDPQPGDSVLDLCAAPGGKLTYIAQRMGNEGRLVANDTAPERLKLVRENCARLGVTCVEVQQTEDRRWWTGEGRQEIEEGGQSSEAGVKQPASGIAPNAPLSSEPSPLFSRILIDAPCSNTGVMRRRVDLRWRIRAEEILRLRDGQLELLAQAAPLLRPGGTLVYSTCSLEPEENGQVVSAFLSRHADFKLESEQELLPFTDEVDGAYVARMTKSAGH